MLDTNMKSEFSFYGYTADLEREPITALRYFTPIGHDGWDGEKLYRTLILDIDTQGQPVTLTTYLDESTIAVSPSTPTVITTNERSKIYLSFANLRGRQSFLELTATTATRFRYYGHYWEYEREPIRQPLYSDSSLIQVEEIDQLRLNNLNLRFTNAQLSLANLNQLVATLQVEAETLKQTWQQKYGADFQHMTHVDGLTWKHLQE